MRRNDNPQEQSNKTRKKRSRKRLGLILVIDLLLLVCVAGLLVRMVSQRADFALTGDQEMTISVGEEFNDPGATPASYRVSGSVDASQPGDYTLEYTLMGRHLTRTVHVVDPDRIVLGLKGSPVQLVRQGDPYIESGAFATDKEGTTIDPSGIQIEGSVDTSVPGDYEVKYSVSGEGALSTAVRTVRVLSEADFGDAASSIPVMMYHWVYTTDDVPDSLDGNWILNTELEEQLKYLSDNNYYYPSWKEFRAWLDEEISLPAKSIIMTFDDGKIQFLKYGIPLLEKYEVPATSFMICWDKNDARNKLVKYASRYVDYESHSYAMHQAGDVPGYRGILAAMSKDEILADLRKAQEIVKNNEAFAYPYGDWTSAAVEALDEQGILCSFTTQYGKSTQSMNPQELPRVRVMGDAGFDIWRASIE